MRNPSNSYAIVGPVRRTFGERQFVEHSARVCTSASVHIQL